METVEVVIKIPIEKYKLLTEMGDCVLNHNERAIKQGTVLPKGHGRLIDADKIKSTLHNKAFDLARSKSFYAIMWAHKMVRDAPTVIEADKDGDADG